MRRQLFAALRAIVVFTALVGLAYPLAVTGVAHVAFRDEAKGSLIERDGQVVGSRLLGQSFAGEQWFQPRPSAAGWGYDAMSSSASGLGPTNPELLNGVAQRVIAYRTRNGLQPGALVPVDAVTASASGLDPHISVENARLQAPGVARARGMSLDSMLRLVDDHTTHSALGFLGERGVNVVELNVALSNRSGEGQRETRRD